MEHSTAQTANKKNRAPLGMNSFSAQEQKQFGQNIRLAMACIEGTPAPSNSKAMPSDTDAIRHRLITINQDITSNQADMLELLVRFDERQGWQACGAKSCAAWMNLEMGISYKTSWDYLRIGRYLRKLPTTSTLFKVGKLSWSKVRLIACVANADNEKTLCHAAMEFTLFQPKFMKAVTPFSG